MLEKQGNSLKFSSTFNVAEAFSESFQTPEMDRFVKIVDS